MCFPSRTALITLRRIDDRPGRLVAGGHRLWKICLLIIVPMGPSLAWGALCIHPGSTKSGGCKACVIAIDPRDNCYSQLAGPGTRSRWINEVMSSGEN